jgi:hypothetical protein
VLPHFIDGSALELFELLRDLASDDDRILSTEILSEFIEGALDTVN